MLLFLLETAATDSVGATSHDLVWMLVKMVLVLVIVCGGAMLLLRFVPKIGALQGGASAAGIEILGRRALDPKKHLWIVRVGTRNFLLGTSEQSVQCVAELNAADLPATREGKS